MGEKTPLEAWMQKGAHELGQAGVTFVPVADSDLQPVQEWYDDLMRDKNSLAELSDGDYSVGRDGAVKVEVKKSKNGLDKSNCIKFANLYSPEHNLELCKSILAKLQPLLMEVFGEPVVPLASQFILGNQSKHPEKHADFCNRNAMTLLTPLFDYEPEQCSFHYWKINKGDELSTRLSTALGTARGHCFHLNHTHQTYHYRRGEGVLFRGDVVHRTAPFTAPEGGWGKSKCRAIFAIVMVAPNAFKKSGNYRSVLRVIQKTSGHHAHASRITSELEDAEREEGSDSEEADRADMQGPGRTSLFSCLSRPQRCHN